MSEVTKVDGLLVFPWLRVQNVNAISAPMTWGFPSMTAFLGLMWALERKIAGRWNLIFNGVGVVCHDFEPQVTSGGFSRAFCLTRNPLAPDGSTSSIVEEGKAHLDLTLIFGIAGGALADSLPDRAKSAKEIGEILETMRIAGGTIVRGRGQKPTTPYLIRLEQDHEKRILQFRGLRRRWLPGFALVHRDDLLGRRFEEMRPQDPAANLIDAWLDLSRLNILATKPVSCNDSMIGKREEVEWRYRKKEGWIVPIPVGYASLSDTQPAGSVENARDQTTPFRFVESLYSIGQWIGPHRLNDVHDLLWYAGTDTVAGMYSCQNDFAQNHQQNNRTGELDA